MKCPVVKWQKGQSYRPILVQYADTTKSIVSKAYGRSPEEQIPAGSHSVIRGLVTNRLMVRREPCYLFSWITVSRAHIGGSQLARTVLLPGPSRMLSDCFVVICGRYLRSAADFCLITLIIRADGCHGLAAERCPADERMIPHAAFSSILISFILFLIPAATCFPAFPQYHRPPGA